MKRAFFVVAILIACTGAKRFDEFRSSELIPELSETMLRTTYSEAAAFEGSDGWSEIGGVWTNAHGWEAVAASVGDGVLVLSATNHYIRSPLVADIGKSEWVYSNPINMIAVNFDYSTDGEEWNNTVPAGQPAYARLWYGGALPSPGGDPTLPVSSGTIYSLDNTDVVGRENLTDHQTLSVGNPSQPAHAAPKSYVDAVDAKAQQALKWWEQRAEGDAHMDGNRLHLGGGWALLGEAEGFAALSFDAALVAVAGDTAAQFAVQISGENVLTARFDTNPMHITDWSGYDETMWVDVHTNGLHESDEAWVEYTDNLLSGVWYRASNQSDDLPTTNETFRIEFDNDLFEISSTGFFRVMTPANSLAAFRSTVPMRVPSMMISESNSVVQTTFPGVLTFEDTDPPSAVAGHGHIYVHNGEVYAMDQDGNAQQLSSHREGRPVLHEFNVYSGWGTRVDLLDAFAGVEGAVERYRLPPEQRREWDADQQFVERRSREARQQWTDTPTRLRRTEEPVLRTARQMPQWLMDAVESETDPLDEEHRRIQK